MAQQTIIDHINKQVHKKNRNFTAVCVGRTGTGKSWGMIRLGEVLDPDFSVDHIVFRISDLLDLVNGNSLKEGSVIVFDEAGIDASNRQHYMNKLNKALSFLLQTWRYRRIILLVTIPDIAFIDSGVRRMFDAVFETMNIIESERVCVLKIKFIQVNAQSGKAYYKRPRNSSGIVKTKIKKPSTKLRNQYEKKKAIFLEEFYKDMKETLEPVKENEEKKKMEDKRRCLECGGMGIWSRTENRYKCRNCPNIWQISATKATNV